MIYKCTKMLGECRLTDIHLSETQEKYLQTLRTQNKFLEGTKVIVVFGINK